MNRKKISFLVATFVGLATLAPVLVNAQSASISGQVGINPGGPMMRAGGGFGGGRMNGRGMMPGAMGKVTAISGNTITITEMMRARGQASTTPATAGKTITVDASNAVVMKDNATSSLSAITIGDNIFAEGTLSGTNIVATKIRDGMGGMMNGGKGPGMNAGAMANLQGNGQPIVAGNVSAVNGNTITITNKSNVSYTVDASNAKVIVDNATSSIGNVTVGNMVMVQGAVNGNAVVAATIVDNGTMPAANSNDNGGQNDGPQGGMNGGQHGGFFGGIMSFVSHLFGF